MATSTYIVAYATAHGAVNLALAGQAEGSKGLEDAASRFRLLLFHLEDDRGRFAKRPYMGFTVVFSARTGLRVP